MKKKYFLFIIIMILSASLQKSYSQSDSTNEDIDKVFVREEEPPTFKGGIDSLNSYLAQQQIDMEYAKTNESVILRFIVSIHGNISELMFMGNTISIHDELREAILKSSGMWNSAHQNGRPVNAYCSLKITIHKRKITAEMQQ